MALLITINVASGASRRWSVQSNLPKRTGSAARDRVDELPAAGRQCRYEDNRNDRRLTALDNDGLMKKEWLGGRASVIGTGTRRSPGSLHMSA